MAFDLYPCRYQQCHVLDFLEMNWIGTNRVVSWVKSSEVKWLPVIGFTSTEHMANFPRPHIWYHVFWGFYGSPAWSGEEQPADRCHLVLLCWTSPIIACESHSGSMTVQVASLICLTCRFDLLLNVWMRSDERLQGNFRWTDPGGHWVRRTGGWPGASWTWSPGGDPGRSCFVSPRIERKRFRGQWTDQQNTSLLCRVLKSNCAIDVQRTDTHPCRWFSHFGSEVRIFSEWYRRCGADFETSGLVVDLQTRCCQVCFCLLCWFIIGASSRQKMLGSIPSSVAAVWSTRIKGFTDWADVNVKLRRQASKLTSTAGFCSQRQVTLDASVKHLHIGCVNCKIWRRLHDLTSF